MSRTPHVNRAIPRAVAALCVVAASATADDARPIAGVVRDAVSGEAIAGAVVAVHQADGDLSAKHRATADADGRYRLDGLPAGAAELVVIPPPDRPFFVTGGLRPMAADGDGPIRLDVALRPGVWIEGRVNDAEAGGAVAATVSYFPRLDNPHAVGYPNFDRDAAGPDATTPRARTDADGRFRVVGLPGKGVVAVRADDPNYLPGKGDGPQVDENGRAPAYFRPDPATFHLVRSVDQPADAAPPVELALTPGLRQPIALVDAQGEPVEGAMGFGLLPEAADMPLPLLDGKAEVVGVQPGRWRTVAFVHEGKRIGAMFFFQAIAPPPGKRYMPEPMRVQLSACPTVTGRLVDPDGKPVAGEIVASVARADNQPPLPIGRAATDDDGRFRLDALPPAAITLEARDRPRPGEPERFKPVKLLDARWHAPEEQDDLGTIDVTSGLAYFDRSKDVPIVGRIVDGDGRPVAGATVRINMLKKPKDGDLSPWLDDLKATGSTRVELDYDQQRRVVPRDHETDADGRFRIEGLGPDRVVELHLSGPSIVYDELQVVTRKLPGPIARREPTRFGPDGPKVLGAEFTVTARPSRPIVGVVREAKTGQPLPGVRVFSDLFAGAQVHGVRRLETATDADGRFNLAGLPDAKGNAVFINPPAASPYFPRVVDVADPAAELAVELHRGLLITGTVTDHETGKPIAGARVYYLPYLDNPHARAMPDFGRQGYDQGRYTTGPDGTFRLPGLPGRAIVGADDPAHDYLKGFGSESIPGMDEHGRFPTYAMPIEPGKTWPDAMKAIDPEPDAEAVHMDLELTAGDSVRLRVVDADGQPVGPVEVGGHTRTNYLKPDVAAEFAAANIRPDEVRQVMARSAGRHLGIVVDVRPGDDAKGPVVLTLKPTATIVGRVLDADGKPLAGAAVEARLDPSRDYGIELPMTFADKDGRFRIEDVPAGTSYTLAVTDNRPGRGGVTFAHAEVKPGETTDAADVRFKPD